MVDGGSYESLLQWLVEHTGVEEVRVSRRAMTRIRGTAGFELDVWRRGFAALGREKRIVRVWTESRRPPWEFEKMMRLRCNATEGALIPVQIYFWSEVRCEGGRDGDGKGVGKVGMLQLDPRWLTRLNDGPEKILVMEEAVPLIDDLMGRLLKGRELKDYKDASRHCNGDAWVYQIIVVA